MVKVTASIWDTITIFILLILWSNTSKTDAGQDEDESLEISDSMSTECDVTSCLIEVSEDQRTQIAGNLTSFQNILNHSDFLDIIQTNKGMQPIKLTDLQKESIFDNFRGFFTNVNTTVNTTVTTGSIHTSIGTGNTSNETSDEERKRRRSLDETVPVCPTESETIAVGLAVDASGCLVQVVQLDIYQQLFPVQLCEEDDSLITGVCCRLDITLRKAYVLVLTDTEANFEIRDVCVPICRAVFQP